jgi:hypothetical protein
MHFRATGLAVEAWIHLAQDGVLVNLAVKQDSVKKKRTVSSVAEMLASTEELCCMA